MANPTIGGPRVPAKRRDPEPMTDCEIEDSLNRLTAEFLAAEGRERVDLLSRFKRERDRLLRERGADSRACQIAKYQYSGLEHLFWHPNALAIQGLEKPA